ncbi:flavoprotein [Xylariaceae sp. FL1019]|nr:flavoprotein [Xylariaceae sp. FL1019]
MADVNAPTLDPRSPPEVSCLKRLPRHDQPSLTATPSFSSLHEMPRMKKLHMLVAANGPRDVAYAQAIAVRLLKDTQIETRALVDDVPQRLTHEIMVMENRSLSTAVIDADQRTKDAIEAARQNAFGLVEWADVLVLAPIDADHLAKMMLGVADTTTLEVLRSWDVSKKIFLVPGMSMQQWNNPMTKKQLSKIKRKWNWIKVMSPILWHYEGKEYGKRVVTWDGFTELMGIIKNQAELMCLGHDVEVAAKKAMRTSSPTRVVNTLPPEIWSQVYEFVGDWETAMALDIYTTLPQPADWGRIPNATDPSDVYMFELEWLILTCPNQDMICQRLSEAPKGFRYLSSLAVKLMLKFSLVKVLRYLETHMTKVFWASFSAKFFPNKASGVYARLDILNWWFNSPSFLKKEYDAQALDDASRMGFVHVLDWWLQSRLPLKFTESALEFASKEGHLLVLEWWKEAASIDHSISLKPGRSLLVAAQHGQTAVLRWWETSGIPVGYSEGVCKLASAQGQTAVLDTWFQLKGEKISFDSTLLVTPTKLGHVSVLEWWKQYARGEQPGDNKTHRVEYKTCDIEEALEDAVGDPRPVRRWWADNGLDLDLGNSEWMKVRRL